MILFDKNTLGRQAKELGFVRDTFEKVCRLADVLKFIESDEILSNCLALKGGTAINLTIFNLPRLSVDIDLDFSENVDREKMFESREIIYNRITKYMLANGYILSEKSKYYHALDSFIFQYQNAGGMRDNIKIEINYIMRSHIFPVTRRKVYLPWLSEELSVLSVDPMEIFASKITALLNRAAPRDLYDIYNLLKFELFNETEQDMLHRCIVFYLCIGSDKIQKEFTFENFEKMPQNKIKTDLLPVLRFGTYFDLKSSREKVLDYLKKILKFTPQDIDFIDSFSVGKYKPELIFEDAILKNIISHPMAIWKCNKIKENDNSNK